MYIAKVPDGKHPGDTFQKEVDEPSGDQTPFTIKVPPTHGPGMYVPFYLPMRRARQQVLDAYGKDGMTEE